MNAPAHHSITLAASLGVCSLWRPEFEHGLIFAGVAQAATMIPDRAEKIGRFRLLPHRGPTHRPWAVVLFVGLVLLAAALLRDDQTGERWLVPYLLPIGLGALLGYGGHLYLADRWTVSGLPGGKGWRIRTGRWSEQVVRVVALLACIPLGFTLLPEPTRTALAGDRCERRDRAVRIYLSQRRYPNVVAHIKRSWREGYPHVLTINRDGAEQRRQRLLDRWERSHPQPKGDGLDLDERPAAMLRRHAYRASVMAIPASENRSEGARMRHALDGVCDGERVMYVFTR